jgi:AAA15 family ATPase/GTPase
MDLRGFIMIERIEIENFRLFKHFVFDGVKQINLIAGENNVGKTTLLEAIMMYNSQDMSIKILTENRKRSPDQMLMVDDINLFTNNDTEQQIKISINNGMVAFGYIDTHKKFLNKATQGIIVDVKYIRDAYNIIKLCEYFGPIATDYGKLEKLVLLLQELEPRIKDLRLGVENGKTYIIANIGLPQGVSMSSLGDGINKLLTILLTALRDDCNVLLLDEIETGFHYSFYPKLWNILAKIAKETGCQIFATTHSYECIEGAKELNAKEPEMFGFVRLARDEDNIIAKTYENDVFEYSLTHNWEVR